MVAQPMHSAAAHPMLRPPLAPRSRRRRLPPRRKAPSPPFQLPVPTLQTGPQRQARTGLPTTRCPRLTLRPSTFGRTTGPSACGLWLGGMHAILCCAVCLGWSCVFRPLAALPAAPCSSKDPAGRPATCRRLPSALPLDCRASASSDAFPNCPSCSHNATFHRLWVDQHVEDCKTMLKKVGQGGLAAARQTLRSGCALQMGRLAACLPCELCATYLRQCLFTDTGLLAPVAREAGPVLTTGGPPTPALQPCLLEEFGKKLPPGNTRQGWQGRLQLEVWVPSHGPGQAAAGTQTPAAQCRRHVASPVCHSSAKPPRQCSLAAATAKPLMALPPFWLHARRNGAPTASAISELRDPLYENMYSTVEAGIAQGTPQAGSLFWRLGIDAFMRNWPGEYGEGVLEHASRTRSADRVGLAELTKGFSGTDPGTPLLCHPAPPRRRAAGALHLQAGDQARPARASAHAGRRAPGAMRP